VTTKAVKWAIGFGGRIAHVWNQVGTYTTQFMALCNPTLTYGSGWDASGYPHCPKCEKLVSNRSQEERKA
jgi:hypothetical protein